MYSPRRVVLNNHSERLTKSTLLAYASPAIPIAAMGIPIAIYIPPFYAQEMGLGLSVVGLVFMLARIWDVITDPVLGVMSDRFPTRWGRRRHWLVLSVPIMLFSTWKLFMPDPEQVTAAYLMVWMLVMYIAWTLLSLTHQAWGAELSPDYNERTRIQGTREVFLIIGAIVCLSLPSIIEQMNPEDLGMARVASMGWMVILLLPITVLWAVLKVSEKKTVAIDKISWKETFTVVKGNSPLQRLLLSEFTVGVSQGITASLFLFLAADVLKLGSWSSIILLLYFFSGIFYVPLFALVSKKVGKHVSLAICASVYAVGINFLWFIPEGSVVLTSVIMVILGMNMGAPGFLLRSMLADIVDEDLVKTQKQRTGLFFSLYNMIEKIGGAVAIGITYLALDMMGFVPGGENTESAIMGFQILFVVPAMLLNFLIAYVIKGFPLDKARQERNRKILESRQSSQNESLDDNGVQGSLNPN